MGKNTIFARRHKVAAALIFLLVAAGIPAFMACSRDEPTPRSISGHSFVIGGVAHSRPPHQPYRFCASCHGATLAGGTGFAPSCYQCHGRNWTQTRDEFSLRSPAPVDHAIDLGAVLPVLASAAAAEGFRHKQGLFSPAGDCDACHGADLRGDDTHPGCYTCHGALWQEAAVSGLGSAGGDVAAGSLMTPSK